VRQAPRKIGRRDSHVMSERNRRRRPVTRHDSPQFIELSGLSSRRSSRAASVPRGCCFIGYCVCHVVVVAPFFRIAGLSDHSDVFQLIVAAGDREQLVPRVIGHSRPRFVEEMLIRTLPPRVSRQMILSRVIHH
jgi:hypothetical protein